MKYLRSLLLVLPLACAGVCAAADWKSEITPPVPGGFPMLRPVRLTYQCGWSGITAGTVVAEFTRPAADSCMLTAKAGTTGLARTMWRLDATHQARADALTLRPISVRQLENYHAQTVKTELDFDDAGVEQFRQTSNEQNPAKRKRVVFRDLYDLQTALLFVRSQKLQNGQVYRLVTYPATTPYLATITVLGRERVKVKAGSYDAIKMDLKLEKVNKDGQLEPHGKFKKATGWISDDEDRLPLRLNAQIFVGSVWVELEKAEPVPEEHAGR